MKKLKLILLFTIVCANVLTLQAQKQSSDTKIYLDENWKKTCSTCNPKYYRIINYDKDSIVYGIVKDYYISGKLQSEDPAIKYNYKTNKLYLGTGRRVEYFENGNVCVETNFVNGKINGQYKSYHENGSICYELTYTNGVMNDGNYTTYYDSGEKYSEGIVTNGNFETGTATVYYKNGKIKEQINYEKSVENIESTGYYDTGEIKFRKNSNKKNQKIYKIISYNRSGEIIRTLASETGNNPVREKWMLLASAKQPTFYFDDYSDSIIVTNSATNKKMTIFEKGGGEGILYIGWDKNEKKEGVSNYSFFFDEYFQQERGIYNSLTYVSPYKINFHCQMNWKNWLGYSESKYDFVMIKDLKEENDKSEKELSKSGIVYRTDFKYGKIGEDYVPAITSTYNAGKKYLIDGVEFQEEDYKTQVDDGNYTKDVKGYTAVYQLINTSNKIYLVSYAINGTSKMTDIVKNTKWFSYNAFNTDVTFTDFDYKKQIILAPNESFKDQFIAGVEIPINYALLVKDIIEVTPAWFTNLKTAISGNNYSVAKSFLNDPIAAKYFKYQIEKNINQLQENQIKNYTELNRKNIAITISPENPVLFDPDFESDVVISILNNTLDNIKVNFETSFGKFEEILKSKNKKEITRKIKGVNKADLKATIISIEKL